MDIDLILFDFGGVIAPEGFQLGVLKLALMYNRSFREMYNMAGYEASFKSGFTAGKIDEEGYWKIVSDKLGVNEDMRKYTYLFIDNFQPRKEMIELVKSLKKGYKVGIFSDQTNWLYDIDRKYSFLNLFDYSFVSYDLGYTKHDKEFYRIPSRETGIDPSRIIVVDDKPRVVNEVVKSGMNGYLFTSVDECKSYLSKLKDK